MLKVQVEQMCRKGFYHLLKENSQSPNKVFLVTDTRAYTYKETLKICNNLIYFFHCNGINRGNMVALQGVRDEFFIFLFYSLQSMGALVVLTDAHFPIVAYTRDCGVDIRPEFFITGEYSAVNGVWHILNGTGEIVSTIDFSDIKEKNDAQYVLTNGLIAGNPAEGSVIIFTSGSMGKRKAVLLSQRNIIAAAADGGWQFTENRDDLGILVLPTHHIFAIAMLAVVICYNHSVYIPSNLNVKEVLKAIKDKGVTCIYSVPTFLLQLVEQQKQEPDPVTSLRFCIAAAGPSTAGQAREIERVLHLTFIPIYGMSEYVAITTYPYDTPAERRLKGVGRFYPLTEGKIVDEQGNTVQAGQEGEICVKGDDLFLEYYNDKQATSEAIDGDGFFHTGDLAKQDADGTVYLCGRKKDIIIRCGENLSVGKIEHAIAAIEGVAGAVVVGIPHPLYGEIPCAMIVTEKGNKISEQLIRKKLSECLSKIEIPEIIEFVNQFPLTHTGKADKQTIKQILMEKGDKNVL